MNLGLIIVNINFQTYVYRNSIYGGLIIRRVLENARESMLQMFIKLGICYRINLENTCSSTTFYISGTIPCIKDTAVN